jgi:hypothetical protein
MAASVAQRQPDMGITPGACAPAAPDQPVR